MANLDHLYSSWKESGSDAALNDLFTAILAKAKRLIRDGDAAQDAAVHILSKLDTFTPKEKDAFTRWTFSVCRRRRLESYRGRGHEPFFDDSYIQDEAAYRDWSRIPESLRPVATQLFAGATIDELAEAEGVTRGSFRRRVLKQACTF